MMHRISVRWICGVTGGLVTVVCLSHPVAAQFGELPAGYVSHQVLEGVRVEISVSFLIDSSAVATFIPAAFNIVTLTQVAAYDTATARYLASRPHLKTAVHSTLFFTALDSFQLDDRPPVPMVGAYWWLRVRQAEALDERTRGSSVVEAAYWSSDSSLVAQLGRHWPPTRYAPVIVERADDGAWHLTLTLPDGIIQGRCQPVGERYEGHYPLPAYSTVWAGGTQPVAFTMYTYYGHYSQGCIAEWTAEGCDMLAVALKRSLLDPPPWTGTWLEDGWHARAGVYYR